MRHTQRFLALLLAMALGTTPLAGCTSCSVSIDGSDDAESSQEASTTTAEPEPEQADPLWVLTQVAYSQTGSLWGEGLTGTIDYTRDERGNIVSETSSEDLTVYEFDKNGNPTKVTVESMATPEAAAPTDAADNSEQVVDGTVGEDLDADALGIVDLEAQGEAEAQEQGDAADTSDEAAILDATPKSSAITHEFDSKGRLVRTVIEDSTTTTYEYDDEGRVAKVTNTITTPDYDEDGNESGTLTFTDTIEYDAQGFPTREVRDWDDGAPTTVTYTYEAGEDGLPATGTVTQESPLETTTAELVFEYDENGNIVHLERTSEQETYVADYSWELVEEPSEYVRMQSTMRSIQL